jgi:hypothetical protein
MTFNTHNYRLEVALLLLIGFLFSPTSNASCTNGTVSPHCGRTPTSIFDDEGRLWAAFVVGQHVYVSHSSDLGKHFSIPVKVNPLPQKIYTNGENRPKIQLGTKGNVFVSWTEKTAGRFTGDIHFSRSTDTGQHFDAIKTINDDGLPIGHRFDAMSVTPSGTIYIVWLDKRDRVAAKKENTDYPGISLYYTISTDQGNTFSKNIRVAEHTCECCRIAITPTGKDNVAVMWRHIYPGGYRDHAIGTLTHNAPLNPYRATVDEWKTDACPHHGPDIDYSNDNHTHMVWFSNGKYHKGITYGQFSNQSNETTRIFSIDDSPQASHPQVKKFKGIVWVVWKSFEKDQSVIKYRFSLDNGNQWSTPHTIASTSAASDHPLLLNNGKTLFINWHTGDEGLQFIPLNVNKDKQQ